MCKQKPCTQKNRIRSIIDRLEEDRDLSDRDFLELLKDQDPANQAYLEERAGKKRDSIYGKKVYLRGLIEVSNHCSKNCNYCGIRAGNPSLDRYRMTEKEILKAVDEGAKRGFSTFVIQGGEDSFFTGEKILGLTEKIKKTYPDKALTLSLGVLEEDLIRDLAQAGLDRYLLRHEAAGEELFSSLHPASQSLALRKKTLFRLKKYGIQTGSGFMVGAPGQEDLDLLEDLRFLQELNPEMIGIGPFIAHKESIYKDYPSGDALKTIKLLAILRLVFPYSLLPATTSLATKDEASRFRAIEAGANVIMPNLTPKKYREKYDLYDNKLSSGQEAMEYIDSLRESLLQIGYEIDMSRGDSKLKEKKHVQ